MKQIFTFLVVISCFFERTFAQVTISTGLPNSASSLSGTNPGICFTVTNNNSYSVVLTTMDIYRATNQNGLTFTLKYSSTSLSGTVNVTTWTVVATAVASTVTTTGIHPTFSGMNFTIPANTTYRLAIQNNGTNLNYGGSTTTPNSFTSGGIVLGRGDYQISGSNVGYSGGSGSLSITPRFFCGTLIFAPAIANDLSAVSVLTPANNSQLCYNASMEVKVIIKNNGSASQGNFPIGAFYSGPVNGNLSTTYTGTLAPGVSDTVVLGNLNLSAGTYSLRSYTLLGNDSLSSNDTTPNVSFIVKPPVSVPMVASDTVCPGDNAFLSITAQPNTTYNWYSSLTGGVLLTSGQGLTFSPLAQDTTMYVSALSGGCESARIPVTAAIGTPPSVKLGSDTSFCESIPLILDAGNPGGKYLWSTGDSSQSIAVTNTSGTYWVVVDKYCVTSDTINVNIAPTPKVSGISYVRMDNTYHFTASSTQDVTDYLWIFGDGSTLAGTAPPPPQLISAVHQYDNGINNPLDVKLVVNNTCGTDTAMRMVPTGIKDLSGGEDIKMYPNPASEQLHISALKTALDEVQIFDAQGRLLLNNTVEGNRITVDISSLTSGLYIIRLTSSGEIFTRMVQVVK